MVTILLTIQMLAALVMIGLVLVQHGKGADAGAAFGSGSSAGSLFGASGSANFLSRSTGVLAAVFFVTTLGLAYLGNARPTSAGSVLEGPAAAIPQSSAPVDATIPPASTPAPAAAPAAGADASVPAAGAAAPAAAPAADASVPAAAPAAPAEPAQPAGK
ncbi:preprotein translocase subunit SecG [Comamonas sp.]|uniref:preprotein translocase subunit SecG n=1 Tax=Comamonas sp. TaxID=34028 RepID=UPI0028B1C30B|nr:preprotein translocase subunit SecG [Comamonas sp.]